jgi:hypothetical protein
MSGIPSFLPLPIPVALARGEVPGLPGVVTRATSGGPDRPPPVGHVEPEPAPAPPITVRGPTPAATATPPPTPVLRGKAGAGPGEDLTRGLLVNRSRRSLLA